MGERRCETCRWWGQGYQGLHFSGFCSHPVNMDDCIKGVDDSCGEWHPRNPTNAEKELEKDGL